MEGHVENGSVYCVPFGAGPHGFYYNADIVKTEPKSWSLFWDEQYKGKYAISREHAENNIYITVMGLGNVMNNKTTAIGPLNAAIYNKERGTITNLSNGEFRSRLKTLAENADHHYRIHEKADQIEHLAFSTGWGTAIGELNRKGKNWKVASPSEGTMGWLDGYMIGYSLSQQDDKRDYKLLRRVAEDWVNFTISPRFQLDVMVRFWSAYPTNLSVAPLLTPEELVASHLDDLSYFDTNLVLLPKLTRRQRDRMKWVMESSTIQRNCCI